MLTWMRHARTWTYWKGTQTTATIELSLEACVLRTERERRTWRKRRRTIDESWSGWSCDWRGRTASEWQRSNISSYLRRQMRSIGAWRGWKTRRFGLRTPITDSIGREKLEFMLEMLRMVSSHFVARRSFCQKGCRARKVRRKVSTRLKYSREGEIELGRCPHLVLLVYFLLQVQSLFLDQLGWR